ncbi:Maltase A3 like protein [Argiope bruennichi]|uniref:Maltase A3 like protein n=1 Tax=Argiope bruennichi TaxID=94029 RepID=A0A8T0FSW7_ARGBR|nr:Maltase A3 like protein [Argiope bruennichi]
MKDNGYDITCFIDIDPVFGTMNDFHLFMLEAKEQDLNIIIDFVANHTSDQHPWFIKSINKVEPFTDFYIWVDAKPESTEEPLPPNNWLSKVLQFWLDKGVDGFRIDAASHIFEDERLLDEPRAKQTKATMDEYGYLNHIYTKGMPETYELLKEWRCILDAYSKRLNKPKIMIIEGMEDIEDVILYYGTIHEKIAEIPMNFQFYKVTPSSTGLDIQEIIDAWLKKMPKGKFPNYVISSHDFPRVASRVGSILASSLQMIVLLLPGIPICYYGDEIGMENGIISPEEMKDSFALRTKPSNSRDPMRTPMQWNSGINAGFTNCDKPWLPINTNYRFQNIEVENQDVFSFLHNFKRLVKLRREPSVLLGTFEYALVDMDIFSFTRSIVGANCYLIIVNMNENAILVNLASKVPSLPETARLILTNPHYYEKVLSNRSELSNYAESSTSSNARNSNHPAENQIFIALNNLKLESHQCMVLSYEI